MWHRSCGAAPSRFPLDQYWSFRSSPSFLCVCPLACTLLRSPSFCTTPRSSYWEWSCSCWTSGSSGPPESLDLLVRMDYRIYWSVWTSRSPGPPGILDLLVHVSSWFYLDSLIYWSTCTSGSPGPAGLLNLLVHLNLWISWSSWTPWSTGPSKHLELLVRLGLWIYWSVWTTLDLLVPLDFLIY